ncbi:MAG TPA: FAD:protein FMN transferase [Solirubrobacteraceae bacterium]|nr:FAD:protein FMN transferase [Solirubrobacteraceae bacterium]
MLDDSFPTMGTVARVVRDRDDGVDVASVFAEIDRRLSRFDPRSDLSRLNADPRASVPAGQLLRAAVAAALRVASLTGGLVDPTLLGALCRAGYSDSRARVQPASLAPALASAPPRRPARSGLKAHWRMVEVDDGAGVIRRPPGVEIDLGGSAKGWAADFLAARLGRSGRFAVDCGGDLRIQARCREPWEVRVRHPLTGGTAHTLFVRSGGVATSGIDVRVWECDDGEFAHHLIDPATGRAAWTGLIAVTALAPTALEAEALGKAALLSGPAGGRLLLGAHEGGVLIHDDGAVEMVNERRRRLSTRRAWSDNRAAMPEPRQNAHAPHA